MKAFAVVVCINQIYGEGRWKGLLPYSGVTRLFGHTIPILCTSSPYFLWRFQVDGKTEENVRRNTRRHLCKSTTAVLLLDWPPRIPRRMKTVQFFLFFSIMNSFLSSPMCRVPILAYTSYSIPIFNLQMWIFRIHFKIDLLTFAFHFLLYYLLGER